VRESQKNSAVNVKGLDWRKKYENSDVTMGPRPVSRNTPEVKELVSKQQRPPSTSSTVRRAGGVTEAKKSGSSSTSASNSRTTSNATTANSHSGHRPSRIEEEPAEPVRRQPAGE